MPFVKILKTSVVFLLVCLPFLVITYLTFLNNPQIWPDEALFTDIAVNTGKFGYPVTSLFGSHVADLGIRAFWTPPLYYYILSVWIHVFGSGIVAVRLFSTICAVVALGGIFFLTQKFFKKNIISFIAVFIVSIDPGFLRSAQMARMEMVTFVLSLLAFLFYLSHLHNSSRKSLFFASFFCGLAFITHPMGALSLIVIFLHILLTNRTVKRTVVKITLFAIPLIVVTGIWLTSMVSHLNIFFKQTQYQLALKSTIPYYVVQFFQTDIFGAIFLIIYAAILLFFIWIFFKNRSSFTLFVLIGAVITSIAVFFGREIWYSLYIQPFLALMMIFPLNQITGKLIFKFLTVPLLLAMSFVMVYLAIQTILDVKSHSYDYNEFTKLIEEKVPPRSSIYLSTIPDAYFGLKNSDYQLYEFPPIQVPNKDYYTELDQADYIVAKISTDDRLLKYIFANQVEQIPIDQDNGYFAVLFKLKPRNKRIPLL